MLPHRQCSLGGLRSAPPMLWRLTFALHAIDFWRSQKHWRGETKAARCSIGGAKPRPLGGAREGPIQGPRLRPLTRLPLPLGVEPFFLRCVHEHGIVRGQTCPLEACRFQSPAGFPKNACVDLSPMVRLVPRRLRVRAFIGGSQHGFLHTCPADGRCCKM